MYLMINIDDQDYSEIIEDSKIFRDRDIPIPRLYKVIESGVPLSKDHGRIVDLGKIDKDRIEKDNSVMAINIYGTEIEAIPLDYLYNLPDLTNMEVDNEYT